MKRSTKSIVLIGLFVALLISYKVVERLNQPDQVSEEEGSFVLTERTEEELVGLRWTDEGGECAFEKEDGEWRNADDPDFPTDQEAVQDLADRLLALRANRRITDVASLEDYGFSEESYAVAVQWSDGETTRYVLGDATPFGDGYYLRIEGETGVIYTLDRALSAMFGTLTDLAVLEDIPAVEDVAQLIIDAQLDLSYQKTSVSIDPNQHWYDTMDGEPMVDAEVEALIDSIQGLKWEKLVSAKASEEELAQRRLSDEAASHILLMGEGGEKLELLIGAANEEGGYDARLSGSERIYTLSADDVDRILDVSADGLWNSQIFPLEYEDVQHILCEARGRTLEYTLVSADGEDDESDPVREVWSKIGALKGEERCEDAAEGTSILEITVTNTNGMRVQYSFFEYSVDFYQVITDEGRNLLVSADDVDRLIRTLRQ